MNVLSTTFVVSGSVRIPRDNPMRTYLNLMRKIRKDIRNRPIRNRIVKALKKTIDIA